MTWHCAVRLLLRGLQRLRIGKHVSLLRRRLLLLQVRRCWPLLPLRLRLLLLQVRRCWPLLPLRLRLLLLC